MDSIVLWSGKAREVQGLVKRERLIYEDDLDIHLNAKKGEIDEYIIWLADEKYPHQNTHFSRKISGYHNLYELRPWGIRLFYFYYGKNAVITSACLKKKKKENQQDMDRANRLKEEAIRED